MSQGFTGSPLAVPISGANGGTGVVNSGKTITIGGNFTLSGAYTLTETLTANSSFTLPTTGACINKVVSQIFTGAGTYTYTPTAGMQYCIIYCVGSGGAGGGAVNPGSNIASCGSGGGAGALSVSTVSKATIGASQTVTIGAGGTAVSGAGGNNGNTTSVGSIITASGGSGGAVGGSANNVVGSFAQGGAPGTGDVAIRGNYGSASVIVAAGQALSGGGGISIFGTAGLPRSSVLAGNAGVNGSGGGGSLAYNASGASAGGAGGDGIVVIYEYVCA